VQVIILSQRSAVEEICASNASTKAGASCREENG
jgi:hypothetical protein